MMTMTNRGPASRTSRHRAQPWLLRALVVLALLCAVLPLSLLQGDVAAAGDLCASPVPKVRGCILVKGETWHGVDVHLNKYSDTPAEFLLSPSAGDYGFEWQCVELVQRFYAQVLYKDDADYQARYKKWGGNAVTFWANYPKNKGITAIPNDGMATAPPQWGDILVFDDGGAGHVAIVTGPPVDGKVPIVEQNVGWAPKSSDGKTQTLTKASGQDVLSINANNFMDGSGGWVSKKRATIKGWLHSDRNRGIPVSPGTTVTTTTTVVTPLIPSKPDIVFLADTTGSMGGAIDNVRTKAATIMQEVKAIHGDARFGVAEYKDFGCDANPYLLNQSVTANTALVQAGINNWFADGGCDDPEAQLNALYQLANDVAGTGWGAETNRIVVWFGDVPGHDPSNGHGLGQVIDKLKAAKIRVIAISTGYNDLDGCAETCGQATKIVTATGGKLLSTASGASVSAVPDNTNAAPYRPTGAAAASDDVAAAIMAGLKSLPTTVTPQLTSGSPYVTVTVDPPSKTVTSGETVIFTVTIVVSKDIPAGTAISPQLDFLLDGQPRTDAMPLRIIVPVLRTLVVSATDGGSTALAGGTYFDSTPVMLTATPVAGYLFTGWVVDGQARGWANPFTVFMDSNHTVQATFVAATSFADVPTDANYAQATAELAARGIIKGCDPAAGHFCPADNTLRAQMAALIVRAMDWSGETATNPFADRDGVDEELWQAIAILAAHDVARGYGDGTYGTTSDVLNAQVISFVTRGMVAKGYWEYQTDDGTAYPNIPGDSGHRVDVTTYVHYAGALPDFPDVGAAFPYWDSASTREWFARVLWQALDSSLGVEQVHEGFAGP